MNCPYCNEDVELEGQWDLVGQTFPCPKCARSVTLEHEDTWDEDSQEEWSDFFLVEPAE